MDERPLMASATRAFGVAATVGLRWDEPTQATGIWIGPQPPEARLGLDHQRLDPRRFIAFSRSEVDKIPVGTTIAAPEKQGGQLREWRVDGVERMDADEIRVSVIEEETVFG